MKLIPASRTALSTFAASSSDTAGPQLHGAVAQCGHVHSGAAQGPLLKVSHSQASVSPLILVQALRGESVGEVLDGVSGPPPGEVADLLAAGDAGNRDCGRRATPLRRPGRVVGAHGPRDLVVLGLEAEGAGHAAAAAFDQRDLVARHEAQGGQRRLRARRPPSGGSARAGGSSRRRSSRKMPASDRLVLPPGARSARRAAAPGPRPAASRRHAAGPGTRRGR